MNTSDIAKLRAQTGAGMLDVKKALDEAGGDGSTSSPQVMAKAAEILRKRGIVKAAKRADKIAAEGLVASYIHGGGQIGVLVEVNCETDFVAKNEGFKTLVNDIAMHIAAASPRYLSRAEVPAEVVEKEKDIHRAELAAEGRPAEMIEKIVEGKLGRFYADVCLHEQPFIKDEDQTIEQLLTAKTGEIGEKITVRRFARYELGEGITREKTDFVSEVRAQLA